MSTQGHIQEGKIVVDQEHIQEGTIDVDTRTYTGRYNRNLRGPFVHSLPLEC